MARTRSTGLVGQLVGTDDLGGWLDGIAGERVNALKYRGIL